MGMMDRSTVMVVMREEVYTGGKGEGRGGRERR